MLNLLFVNYVSKNEKLVMMADRNTRIVIKELA